MPQVIAKPPRSPPRKAAASPPQPRAPAQGEGVPPPRGEKDPVRPLAAQSLWDQVLEIPMVNPAYPSPITVTIAPCGAGGETSRSCARNWRWRSPR